MNIENIILGIDIGGTNTKVGVFSNSGELICKWKIKTTISIGSDKPFLKLFDIISGYLLRFEININCLTHVSICIPGVLSEDGKIIKCANLQTIEGYNVLDEARSYYGTKPQIIIENDANAAILGEMVYGAGKEYNNIAMLTLGTGIGSGIIINRQLYKGIYGLGSEIGHICVNPLEQKQCTCGRKGCLQQYLQHIEKDMWAKYERECCKYSSLSLDYSSFPKAIIDFAHYIGYSLSLIGAIVPPELFIIGGGLSNYDYIIFLIKESYAHFSLSSYTDIPIEAGILFEYAGIYGCAAKVTHSNLTK